MAFDIDEWLKNFTKGLGEVFGDRLVFAGIQGSRGRGEASETSDIDVVVVLDKVSTDDLKTYDAFISGLPRRDMVCGFICGREELECWERSDLFHLCYDTQPLVGSLSPFSAKITRLDAKRAVLTGACDIYHACCHNFLHEKSSEVLSAIYKAAFFTLRAKYFCETGKFVRRRSELVELVAVGEKELLLPPEGETFEAAEGRLLAWSAKAMREYGANIADISD
ncbi:MAG: nucleotidyltransferase domain-containing protein [Synergistaceae bacterium]|nr:nucleotidyltransferase domain-containing protein [Synergistaceae bacterium]